jgi:hypothetical protein
MRFPTNISIFMGKIESRVLWCDVNQRRHERMNMASLYHDQDIIDNIMQSED